MKKDGIMVRPFLLIGLFIIISASLKAQEEPQKSLEVYGFAMIDAGYDFKQINPNWYDALRVTKLPTYKDQYAPDGKVFFGVRQTRFGVQGFTPTKMGDLKVKFEFDMFGVGADEGQTTMRLRHAYGELGRWLVGQTNTPFMDGDVWPNTIEYWGPTGMVFYRNVQIRYAPMVGKNEIFIAIERPGAGADKGTFSDFAELDSVRGHLNVPDITAHYKRSGDWGHVQFAAMFRSLKWQDIRVNRTSGGDLGGSVVGWGAHLSSVLNLTPKLIFRGSVVYGEGIENTMNDAPVDVGAKFTGNAAKPLDGVALPILGTMGWFDINWTDKFFSSIGYSRTDINNTAQASPTAYKSGQYALLTMGTTPFKNVMAAVEFQWGKRQNENNFTSDDFKIQFSVKCNFSQTFFFKGGGQN